ncbi:MAG: RIP metalloprotease [Chloroflexi bacterium AL-N1]|nr:RIP metalloprotease [Chloroflexi bacterium AL-N1]NOK77304.1 RIP metalloprotease [Chloroflexi bacterium AL-N5]
MDSFIGGLVTMTAFIFMLGLLVLVHELGHFLTARRLGIKVDEFGIGYPPRAVTLFEHEGVKYTLNWLPIGGFVRFGGEGEEIYGVGSLALAAPWKKILVLIAGPLMNLVLTFVIFAGLIAVNGASTVDTVIDTVYEGTPADAAGFASGDRLMEFDGVTIEPGDTAAVTAVAEGNAGTPIDVVVERDGELVTLEVTPGPWTTEDGIDRVGLGILYVNEIEQVGPLQAIGMGFTRTFVVLGLFMDGIGQLIGGLFGQSDPPEGGVAGVVGIARGTGEIIEREGLTGFWYWTALISLNLFVINLLPIPALDGSHIMFSLIEIVRRGKKIPPEKEAMVHAVGFIMVLGLMVVVTISDVANWISGQPVLPGG